jgi:hypothetical protein
MTRSSVTFSDAVREPSVAERVSEPPSGATVAGCTGIVVAVAQALKGDEAGTAGVAVR